jgi:hypothetical protein
VEFIFAVGLVLSNCLPYCEQQQQFLQLNVQILSELDTRICIQAARKNCIQKGTTEMKLKATLLALAFMLLSAVALAPVSVEAGSKAGTWTEKVTGSLADGGTFKGKVTFTKFESNAEGTMLYAIGTLDGMATKADNSKVKVDNAPFRLPVTLSKPTSSEGANAGFAVTQASCDILFLDLGPLNLDLLGLTIDLSQIVLDINAVPGAGNLLGNLLCAVTGLLDGIGTFLQIADLLNQILNLLG